MKSPITKIKNATLKADFQPKVETMNPSLTACGNMSGMVSAHKNFSKTTIMGKAIIATKKFISFILKILYEKLIS
jgi:hypothetical protein